MNILTSGMPELCESLKKDIHLNTAVFEANFEQILGYTKSHELEKLCIFIDVWNVYGRSFNSMRGQGAAKKIHEIDPNVQILIWDGREYISDELDMVIPPAFQVVGTPATIKHKNQLFLEFENYSDQSIDLITKKFFLGVLSFKDIPKRDCIEITL